jgi:HEAT repeat protein
MKESGWKGFAQSLKRLSAAGRQKLLKLKFRWWEFVSRVTRAKERGKLRKHLEVWSVFLFLLIVVASPLAIFPMLLWLLLFPFVIVSVFLFLQRISETRFDQISWQVLSLSRYVSFKAWARAFDQVLSEGEKVVPNLLQILQARLKFASTLAVKPASLLAIFALGRLKAREAVEPLIEFLKSEAVPEVEKVAAIWALGEIGDQKAIPVLVPFLGNLISDRPADEKMFAKGIAVTEDEFKKRWRWKVRDWAEEALMKLKPEIVELFRKVVEERDKNALFELAKKYRSEIVAALTDLLDRRQRDWVFNAVWALRELKAVEALPKLRRLARWAGPHLREYCQKVIAELEEFSRLPRAVGVGEIEMANLPAIPDPNAIPTENLPRAATPEEKPDRADMS